MGPKTILQKPNKGHFVDVQLNQTLVGWVIVISVKQTKTGNLVHPPYRETWTDAGKAFKAFLKYRGMAFDKSFKFKGPAYQGPSFRIGTPYVDPSTECYCGEEAAHNDFLNKLPR